MMLKAVATDTMLREAMMMMFMQLLVILMVAMALMM
jgi:hypothetical protein